MSNTHSSYQYATVNLTMKDGQTVTIFDASNKYANIFEGFLKAGKKDFEIKLWGHVQYNGGGMLYSRGPNAWKFDSKDVEDYGFTTQEACLYPRELHVA